ncbi:MAG: DUF4160 domain-containing protein [Micrococcaceae bacterium]
MSKHPDNPWWCQEHDAPLMIHTRVQWDEASEAGHVTPEHVMQRLKNIADHVFDNETSIGFDDEGFVVSLTAAGMALPGGVTLCVYPNDHPPPHVHIRVRSHPAAKLRIRLDTGEFMDNTPDGLVRKKLNGLQAAVRENHTVLAGWWQEYHGDPVVIG